MSGPQSIWSNFGDEDDRDDSLNSEDFHVYTDDEGITIEQLASVAGIDLEDYKRDQYYD
jgi:hypothetical protein